MEMTLTTIVNNFDQHMSNLICKKVKHQDHCHDILQEVYIKVMHNMDKISNASNVRSYLLRMADNAVTDHYRSKDGTSSNEVDDDVLMAEEYDYPDASLQLADCCLRPMIEQLEPIYRDALIMTELNGLSQKQYADEAGISVTNVKIRVHRAKQKLKEIIQACCTYHFDKYGNIVAVEKKTGRCCSN